MKSNRRIKIIKIIPWFVIFLLFFPTAGILYSNCWPGPMAGADQYGKNIMMVDTNPSLFIDNSLKGQLLQENRNRRIEKNVNFQNVVEAPDIEVNESLDFGEIAVGDSVIRYLTVKNAGDANLHLDTLYIDGPDSTQFQIAKIGKSQYLAPGESLSVKLGFTPISVNDKSAILIIISNDPDEDSVRVSLTGKGIGTSKISVADSLVFDDTNVHDFSEKNLLIYNSGTDTLKVTATDIGGANANQFKIVNGGATFTVAPHDSHQIVIRFTPASANRIEAILIIRSNDTTNQTIEVALTGTGQDRQKALIQSFSNYPNPFPSEKNPFTNIAYAITEDASVSISIYDLSGNLLVELQKDGQKKWQISEKIDAISWDGRDSEGHELSNGVYICEIIAVANNGKEERQYRKIALMRTKE